MPRKKEHKSINTHKKIARVPTFIQNACKSAKGKINIAKLKYNVPQVKKCILTNINAVFPSES